MINDTCKHVVLTTQRVDVPLCDTNQMTSHINQITRAKVLSRISVNTAELVFFVVDKVETVTKEQPSKATCNVTLKALHGELNKFWNVGKALQLKFYQRTKPLKRITRITPLEI